MVNEQPLRLKFRLTLDPASNADRDAVGALVDIVPPEFRPDVSVRSHLMESAGGGLPLIILTVTGIGSALMWMSKKVVGPPLEEVGEWLRDMVREFRNRRKVAPDSATLEIKPETDPDIVIGLPVSLLEEVQSLSTLAAQLAKALSLAIFRNADRVMLSWDGEHQRWICTIWPANMASTQEYLVYDLNTGKCEKKHL